MEPHQCKVSLSPVYSTFNWFLMMENLFDNLVLAVSLSATVASLVIYLSWISGITEGVKVSENADTYKGIDDTL